MPPPRPTIGPWTLDRPLGAGGMSSVWRVVDPRGEPAALKVLSEAARKLPSAEESFVHESRALARLDHPCIVPVLDCGRVAPDEARTGFSAGAPWLVLPLLSGEVCAGPDAPPDWASVRIVLVRVLRALAHTHAAGLVHRDVKPANVLLPRPHAWAEARLGDFGFALPMREGPGGLALVAGTPAFMAPEQFQPDGRLVDARTDLYALGGVAWMLTTGETPYRSDTWAGLREDHRRGALGTFRPRMDVPARLEGWIRALLTVDPLGRPDSAAEALRPLETMASTTVPGASVPTAWGETAVTGPEPEPGEVGVTLLPVIGSEGDEPLGDLAAPPPTPRQPLPTDGLTTERDDRPVSLTVIRLRPPPLVGRWAERARLWSWLGGDGARAMLLEGPSGFGRSRLMQWLGEKVVEAGAATVWWMHHAERPGPGLGLSGMLTRWLRADGLVGAELDTWLHRLAARRTVLEPGDVAGLAELIAPEEAPRVHFRDVVERLAPVVTLAARAAPVLLLVDDAQWSTESLALTEALLDAGVRVRVLLAVDPARTGLEWRVRLDAARASHAIPSLTLGPLGQPEIRKLAESSLGLAPTLAARLEARAQGSPRFVVDVVRDWWSSGRLEETSEGLRLRGDERIPDALYDAWAAALLPLLADRPREWRHALEIAATLGAEISTEEWRAACRAARVEAPVALVERAIDLGIALAHTRGPDTGWRFVHGGYREVLLEHAETRGRARRWHAACAAALRDRSGVLPAERLAGHLLDANRPAEALPWLRRAAIAEIDGGDRRRALSLLDRLAEATRRARVGHDDPAWADLGWLRARVHRLLGQVDEAVQEAASALAAARAAEQAPETVRAATELADAWRLTGRLEEAERLLAEVEPLAADDPALLGAVLQRRGSVAFARGEVPSMLTFGDGAREAFLRAGDAVSAATALNLVGCGLTQAGRLSEARPLFAMAVSEQDAAGCRWGAADAANNLGYVLIRLGEHVEAQPVLEHSVHLWDRAGSPLGVYPRLNLALLHLELGDPDAAEPHAKAALRVTRRMGWGPHAMTVALATAWAVAARQRDPEEASLRDELQALLAGPGALDPSVHRLLELGGG